MCIHMVALSICLVTLAVLHVLSQAALRLDSWTLRDGTVAGSAAPDTQCNLQG